MFALMTNGALKEPFEEQICPCGFLCVSLDDAEMA